MAKAPNPILRSDGEDTEAVRQWKQTTMDFINILSVYAAEQERDPNYTRMISGLRVMAQSLLAAIQAAG